MSSNDKAQHDMFAQDVLDDYLQPGPGGFTCRHCWATVRGAFLKQHLGWHAHNNSLRGE